MQKSLECHTLEHTMHAFHAKQKSNRSINDVIGVCTKCTMSQKLSKCVKQLSAKLVIVTPNTNYTLVAFLPIIKQIANDDTITSTTDKQIITTKILMADPFQLSYTPNKIISNVSRN